MDTSFGEYLVKKNLITQHELLDAIVEQVSSLPSVLEIVYQKDLLPSEDFLEVLKYQSRNGTDFFEALDELNFSSDIIREQLQDYVAKHQVPIGEILTSRTKINPKQLIDALEEYIMEKGELSQRAKSMGRNQRSKETRPNNVPKVDAKILNKFLKTFDNKAFKRLQNNDFDFDESQKKPLLDFLCEVSAGAHFIKYKHFSDITDGLFNLINEAETHESTNAFRVGLELLNSAYVSLKNDKNLDRFLEEKTSDYQNFMANLKSIAKKRYSA